MRERKCHQETLKSVKRKGFEYDQSNCNKLTPISVLSQLLNHLKAPIYASSKAIVSSLYVGIAILILSRYGSPLNPGLIMLIIGAVCIGEYIFRIREYNYYNITK